MPVVSSVALDPAGKLLAAVGDDHLVRVFDLPSGKLVHRWASHVDWVKASAFRPNGSVLATSGADRRICFWNVMADGRTRSVSEPLPAVIYTLAYSPDGRFLAAAGFADKRVAVRRRAGKAAPRTARAGRRHPRDRLLARRHAHGRRGASRARAHLGRQPAGNRFPTCKFPRGEFSPWPIRPTENSWRRPATSESFDCSMRRRAKPLADLPERPGEVMALCFCGPDTLASAGSGNVIHLWDVASQQERCQLIGHTGSITTLVFNRSDGDADFGQLRHHGSLVGREASE